MTGQSVYEALRMISLTDLVGFFFIVLCWLSACLSFQNHCATLAELSLSHYLEGYPPRETSQSIRSTPFSTSGRSLQSLPIATHYCWIYYIIGQKQIVCWEQFTDHEKNKLKHCAFAFCFPFPSFPFFHCVCLSLFLLSTSELVTHKVKYNASMKDRWIYIYILHHVVLLMLQTSCVHLIPIGALLCLDVWTKKMLPSPSETSLSRRKLNKGRLRQWRWTELKMQLGNGV